VSYIMPRFPTERAHGRPRPVRSPEAGGGAGVRAPGGPADRFQAGPRGAMARPGMPPLPAGWARAEGAAAVPAGPAVPAPTEGMPRGQAVRARIGDDRVAGDLAGYDYKGRPVIGSGAERRIAQWDQVAVDGPADPAVIPTADLRPGALVRPPEKLLAALDRAFDTQVCGVHTAREYIDALHDAGHFVYLTGGAIRDALRVMATEADAPVERIIETLKDIDLVTTAPPPAVRAVAERIGPEHKAGGVWSPPIVDQFGSVLIGGPKAGLPNPEGLDVTSMRAEGAFEEQRRHPDTHELAFPYTFDHSLALDAETRDFACNTLYYDPLNRVIVDPTGHGVADARANRLRVARGATLEKDDNIALRFWKFRMRGFDADPETLVTLRHQANQVLWATPRWKVVNNLVRVAPKDAKTAADVQAFFRQLGQVMHQDGCGRLFTKRLLPLMDRVIHKVENRARRLAQ
jgi:hypothetical protein